MKTAIILASIIGATGIATLSSCDSYMSKKEKRTEKRKEAYYSDAKEELADKKREYLADFEAYRISTSKEISDNEQEIADFKVQIETEKAEARTKHRKEIAEIEARNTALKVELSEYKPKNKEHWKSFKKEFGHDIRELGRAIKSVGTNDVK